MRKITLTIICAIVAIAALAQVPQGISHQAVIRNAANELINNSPVGIKVSILSGSTIYSETHTPISNANGLISFVIGQGVVLSGVFSDINWAGGPYFLKTEADPTGGTNYTIEGISQILSVPYALHAITAETISGNIIENDPHWAASPSFGITNMNISSWNNAYSWGNHFGLYKPNTYIPAWSEITNKPEFAIVATSGSYNDLSDKPAILNSQWTTAGSDIYYNSGNVGIGISEPDQKLHIDGNVLIPPGKSYWIGNVGDFGNRLRLHLGGSNAYIDWGEENLTFRSGVSNSTPRVVFTGAGNVGIGTSVPTQLLDINGQLRIRGGNPGTGKVLTSDANGTAMWQPAAPAISKLSCIDIDGNAYPTIVIGTQIWMAENLRVTKYRNGNTIPNVIPNATWGALTTGAYCWYDNDATANAKYGALYNWFAVNDPRGLCPEGWRVPTDAEWTILTNWLGGLNVAGGKLKAVSPLWNDPNTDATNSSGFSALPGGDRTNASFFVNLGSYGFWWSATESSSTHPWHRGISSNGVVLRNDSFKTFGFSVRCLRDID